MKNHNFKIGDKVKIAECSRFKQRIGDIVGVVVGVNEEFIRVKWKTNGCILCGVENVCGSRVNTWSHPLRDIKSAIKVGQQLLFSFMK